MRHDLYTITFQEEEKDEQKKRKKKERKKKEKKKEEKKRHRRTHKNRNNLFEDKTQKLKKIKRRPVHVAD
jgi:hypothetical protein